MHEKKSSQLALAMTLFGVLAAPMFGGESSTFPTAWRRDGRNLLRYARVSDTLRSEMKSFAAGRQDRQAIKGGEHYEVDRAMISYARLRRGLGAIASRWEENDQDGEEGARAALLAASAHVVMAENAVALVENFADTVWERKLSQEVRRKDVRVVDLFKDVSETLASGRHQKAVLERVERLADGQWHETFGNDELASALMSLLEGSQVADRSKDALFRRLGEKVSHRLTSLRRRIGRGMSKALGAYSRRANGTPYAEPEMHVTGKIVGTGSPFDQRRDEIRAKLEPGDIVIFKHKGDIWDKLIPGYFCHTTVWLGTPEQIEELGVYHPGRNHWSADRAQAFRSHLEGGRTLLEADFVKVQIIPLDFSVGYYDTMLVLRLKRARNMDEAAKKELQRSIVCRALYHLDQDYDFDFDLNTSDSIVCSELAYMAYPDDIDWPWAHRVGDATISPDNLAFMAGPLEDQPLEVVYFNDEGGEVVGAEAWRALWATFEGTAETDFPRPTDPHVERVKDIRARIAPLLQGE